MIITFNTIVISSYFQSRYPCGQDDPHGGLLRPQDGAVLDPDPGGGRALGAHEAGHLLRPLLLHRRRQVRPPQVGVVHRDQEGLGVSNAKEPPYLTLGSLRD